MKIIGHRGAKGYEPENTLRSFRRAIALGAHMVEFDVRRAKDDLVVIHDDTLERTTDANGNVGDCTLFDFRYRISANPGERAEDVRVPSLQEAVEEIFYKNIPVNIEMKSRGIAKDVARLVQWMVVRGFVPANKSAVSSFDLDELRDFQQAIPWYSTGALIGELPKRLWSHPAVRQARTINPSSDTVDERLVREAHRRGKEVLVYTVNDAAGFARMRDLGVDGVFTDYPDRARAFYAKERK